MPACLAPIFDLGAQFFTNQGVILAGGKVQVYLAGTVTPTDTWTDAGLTVKNTNPIVLNSAGRLANPVWLQSGVAYKFILQDSTGASVGMTLDNISGINDPTSSAPQWTASGVVPTYISANSFSVSGDQTATFTVGRRAQATVTSGVVYGTISAATYASLITTVTLVMDSVGLDSGLSLVNVSTYPSVNSPVPIIPPLMAAIQKQSYVAFTTAGTATAFTLTPAPVIVANTAGVEFEVTFNQASGNSPTMSVSGLGALPIKFRDAFGNLQAANFIPSGYTTKMWCDGTNWVINHPMVAQTQQLAATTAANALTITAASNVLDFRSATASSGTITTVASAAPSIVVPSGATLGSSSGVAFRITFI